MGSETFFDPLEQEWAPILDFICYFRSVIRVKYITKDIYPTFLKNQNFLLHLALQPVYAKPANVRQRAVRENTMCFSASECWTTYVKMFFFNYFLRPKLDFTVKKNLKKIGKFWYFFRFDVRYLGNRWSGFDDSFRKLLQISFSFHNRKE